MCIIDGYSILGMEDFEIRLVKLFFDCEEVV